LTKVKAIEPLKNINIDGEFKNGKKFKAKFKIIDKDIEGSFFDDKGMSGVEFNSDEREELRVFFKAISSAFIMENKKRYEENYD